MSEYYVLRDMDNRDDNGEPWETTSPTLAGFIPYIDGPVRDDTTVQGQEKLEKSIDALRRENFPLADAHLRELGIYIRLEHQEGDNQ